MNTLGEKRRRPNEPSPEIYPQGAAESSASASIPRSSAVQLPSMHVMGTHRPQKRRKVAFNCDPVTSEIAHPVQSPPLSGNEVGPSSPASTALVPQSSKATKRTKFSIEVPTSKSGKPKPNTTRVTHQDDEAFVPQEMSRKRGKKKDDSLKGREPSLDHRKSDREDVSPSPETQVKRVRKRKKTKKAAPEPPTGR